MFISNADSIPALRDTFAKKINFMRECAAKTADPEKRKKYNGVAKFMQMKVQHTMFVHKVGMNILNSLKKSAQEAPEANALNDANLPPVSNKEAFELTSKYLKVYNKALLWHDLGRTAEFDDHAMPTGIDHAVVSKDLAEKYTADAMVLLAIRNHGYSTNKTMYAECEAQPQFKRLTAEQKKACKIISLLVRDADKLGNWKTFVNQGINREITRRIKPEVFRSQVSIGDYEMDCVRSNQPINYSRYSNFSGVQIAHMMWSSDMALQATFNAAAKGNFVKGMIDYMDEVARDDTALKIKNGEKDAFEDYSRFLEQTGEVYNIFAERGWINRDESFNKLQRIQSFKKRLSTPGYENPVVLTNGMQRYTQKTTAAVNER